MSERDRLAADSWGSCVTGEPTRRRADWLANQTMPGRPTGRYTLLIAKPLVSNNYIIHTHTVTDMTVTIKAHECD